MGLPTSARKVFEGLMFDVYQWDQEQFDGSIKIFEAVKRRDGVQIIATIKDKIVLLEEEQPYVGKFLSLPGGISEGEDLISEANRELSEETGMVCEKLILWKQTEFSSKVNWDTFYFIAKNCEIKKDTDLDSGERIRSFLVSFDEFVELVLSDEFRNKEFAFMILKMIHNDTLSEFKKLIF